MAILTFLLLLLTISLCIPFYAIGFVYTLIRSIKHGGLRDYFYDIAHSLDQNGGVICGPMFNDWFIKPTITSHRMGAKDETISYVMGKNLISGDLFWFGRRVVNMIDFFAWLFGTGWNHCRIAAEKDQFDHYTLHPLNNKTN